MIVDVPPNGQISPMRRVQTVLGWYNLNQLILPLRRTEIEHGQSTSDLPIKPAEQL
jgi:hypothetical protein